MVKLQVIKLSRRRRRRRRGIMRGEFEDGGGEGECHILTNFEGNSVQLSTTHPTSATKPKSNKQSRKKYRKNALKKYVKR